MLTLARRGISYLHDCYSVGDDQGWGEVGSLFCIAPVCQNEAERGENLPVRSSFPGPVEALYP